MNKDEKKYIFFGELGRSLYLSYKGRTFHRGIPAWRYWIPPDYFASPDKNPDNKCFCSTPKEPEMCDGIYDFGTPYFGAPASISLPHFLYASKKIQSMVEGLNPDPDKHEAYMDHNPTLGVPIGAMVRIQANLMVKPVSFMFGMGDLPVAYYPLLWVEADGEIDGILGWLLRIGMYSFIFLENAPYLALFGGLGVLGYTANIAYKERKVLFKSRDQSIPIEPNYAIDRQTEEKTKTIISQSLHY